MLDESVEYVPFRGYRLVEPTGQYCMIEADEETRQSPAFRAAFESAVKQAALLQANRDHADAKKHVRREIRLSVKHLPSYWESSGTRTVADLKLRMKFRFEGFIREIERYRDLTYRGWSLYNDRATIAEINKSLDKLQKREFSTTDELYEFFRRSCSRFRSSVRKCKPTKIA